MSAVDRTQPSFPPYAELTQTQAWSEKPRRIAADTTQVAAAVETSQSSRYTEGPVLGSGGMGKVLLARDARIGREVALKILHSERELDVEDRARFLREAQVQGQLEHPSIVPVYDVERRADGTTFFTMRRVLGRTLSAILDDLRQGLPAATARYTQRELLTAFATVCLTVDYAHSRGVVHRDLKPANIMLGDFGEVYVLDWGLARLVSEESVTVEDSQARLSMPGTFLGTPLYVAPEQMADPDVDARADVYSLGLILFEILTLERARDPASIYAPVDARTSVRAPGKVAPELEVLCVKATAADVQDRYPTARALHEALVRYLEGDRDLARRRELAAEYARAAAAAIAQADEPDADADSLRTEAVRKLRNALALDPGNAENIRVLAAIITTPPKRLPREVVTELRAQEDVLVHVGARYSIGSTLSWFLFLPVILWIGLRSWTLALLVLVPAVLAAVASSYAARMRTGNVPYWLQLCVITATLFGAAATTTMMGPGMLTPTLIASFAIVMQAHPAGFMRWTALALALVALVTIVSIELVFPSSYVAAGDSIVVVPHMHALPRTPSLLVMLFASMGITTVPCLFIASIRRALNEAQRQNLLQAWQFKRFGEDLIT